MAGSDSALLGAWAVGEGIIVYRTVAREHRPPVPGELLATSGLFVVLALLAQWQPKLAVTLGIGLDIAAFLNLAQSNVIGRAISGPSGPTATGTQGTTGGGLGAGGQLTDNPISAPLGSGAAGAAAGGAGAAGSGFPGRIQSA